MNILNIKGYLLSALAGALIAGGLGAWGAYAVQANKYEARLAKQSEDHALAMKGISDAATKAAQDALKSQQADQAQVTKLDKQLTEEKKNAQIESDKLRADVAAGKRRLFLATQRPAAATGGNNVSAPGSATSVDDAAGAELTGAAQSAYFDLRSGIIAKEKALIGLQEYIDTVCQK